MRMQLNRHGIQGVPSTIQVFYRLQLCTEIFYSRKYGRVKKRNSYTVAYNSITTEQLRFGEIIFFFVINGIPFATINEFKTEQAVEHFQLPLDFSILNGIIYPVVTRCSIATVIKAESISYKCVCTDVRCKTYVVLFPCKISCD